MSEDVLLAACGVWRSSVPAQEDRRCTVQGWERPLQGHHPPVLSRRLCGPRQCLPFRSELRGCPDEHALGALIKKGLGAQAGREFPHKPE